MKRVTSGHAAYVPDFDPPFLTNADFENPQALEQYHRQRPLGVQILFQLEQQEPKTSLVQNDKVLWRHDTVVDIGDWIPALVFGQNKDLTYDISTESNGFARRVRRGFLRKLDSDYNDDDDSSSLFDVGAKVLVSIVECECFRQGTVLSRSEDGLPYRVRLYTGKEVVVEDIGDILPLTEANDEDDLPTLSMATLRDAFEESLEHIMSEEDVASLTLYEHTILKGVTMTAFWNGGNGVLVWNGERRVDINLFFSNQAADDKAASKFYDSFMDEVPFMDLLAKDRQPRGYGGVVNFSGDLDDETPIWWRGAGSNDAAS